MMAEALRLGRLRKGRTAPNPAVGALVTLGEKIIGRGFHERAGAPHAEVTALGEAGVRARGGTLYVTLEPCVARGRTPACAPFVVASGVKRVVIGTVDPNPGVAGKGAAALQEAGLDVVAGVRERECRHLVEDFAKFVATKTPWVTAKFATSLDGKIATRSGDATWISGPAARRYAHRLRWEHGAVAVGAGTLRADDPRLTVRLAGYDQSEGPVRLIISSSAVVPPRARVFEGAPKPPVWVACTRRARPRTVARLTRRGAEIIMCKEEGRRVSLADLLSRLAERNVTSLLVEGGEELLGGFFDRGLVDRVVAVTAPKIIGGKRAKSPVGGRGVGRLDDALVLRETKRRSLGDDVLLEGYLADVDDYFANVTRATERLREGCRGR
ncbi:MAG: bifunctional diaminohydroxyphosphoribosylaminopyrimidine deaminase/5-amino-6-(5-phosphoribosylamino)uracil reductase RibD [candidate division Zixibacteria bacterium]|nr:bifunctional diaminohydroxyphosphoribosylaminopyrimidine deaminase/5-amino-6-(5-phosphoribosylamino)uracil reductase RibD [candidate division Zixibacteria bacterium]